MKSNWEKTLLCLLSLMSISLANAQIKPRAKTDTINIRINNDGKEVKEIEKSPPTEPTQKPAVATTPNKNLIEEIQRDIDKQNRMPPKSPERRLDTEGVQTPVVERAFQAERPAETKPTIIKYRKEKRPLKPYKHELQVETGAFFNQLFRVFGLVNQGDPIPISPYLFGYKYLLKRGTEGSSIRFGVGGIIDKVKEQRGGFADNKVTDTLALNARLGFEFQRRLDESWVWTFGADVHYGQFQRRVNSDSGFDQAINSHTGTTMGFGFNLGIRWDFAPRLSIGSEMSLAFLTSKSKIENLFTANPQFNKVERAFETSSSKFYGPANIYLSLKF